MSTDGSTQYAPTDLESDQGSLQSMIGDAPTDYQSASDDTLREHYIHGLFAVEHQQPEPGVHPALHQAVTAGLAMRGEDAADEILRRGEEDDSYAPGLVEEIRQRRQQHQDQQIAQGLSSGDLRIPSPLANQDLQMIENQRHENAMNPDLTDEAKKAVEEKLVAKRVAIMRQAAPVSPEQQGQSPETMKAKLISQLDPSERSKPWQLDMKTGGLTLPRGWKPPEPPAAGGEDQQVAGAGEGVPEPKSPQPPPPAPPVTTGNNFWRQGQTTQRSAQSAPAASEEEIAAARQQQQDQQRQQWAHLPQVPTKADWDALPNGTWAQGPDGRPYFKPYSRDQVIHARVAQQYGQDVAEQMKGLPMVWNGRERRYVVDDHAMAAMKTMHEMQHPKMRETPEQSRQGRLGLFLDQHTAKWAGQTQLLTDESGQTHIGIPNAKQIAQYRAELERGLRHLGLEDEQDSPSESPQPQTPPQAAPPAPVTAGFDGSGMMRWGREAPGKSAIPTAKSRDEVMALKAQGVKQFIGPDGKKHDIP